jgi:hypothetical protein
MVLLVWSVFTWTTQKRKAMQIFTRQLRTESNANIFCFFSV